MTDKHPKRPREPVARSAKPHMFMLRMGSSMQALDGKTS
jgi:hypothetical protein